MATQPNETQYVSNFNVGGLNLYTNPMYHGYVQQAMQTDGELIRCVNMDSTPLGAKMKRPGYVPFLGTTTNAGSPVTSLFSWVQDNGSQAYLYCFAGSTLSYYDATAGTGTDWILCGNGTFTGTRVGYTVLNNTLIIGDGIGSTRHTTSGTSFTNTTLAPASQFFEQYQNRVFVGTGNTLFYSTTGDPTNWNTSGTSDSSSLTIPGGGYLTKLYKLGDRLHITKNRGNVFRWDGFSLVDISTTLGMTSPYSYGSIEDSGLYLGRNGIYMADIGGPQIISNPVGRYLINENNTGIASPQFGTAPGVTYKYDYLVAVGSTRDDLTDEPLNNAILKYHILKNEWLTYQFNDNPTALHSYIDASGSQSLYFGNSSGQVFKYGGTALADNATAVPAVMDMVFNYNAPWFEKDWRWFWGFFNPGCEAQVQVALVDTFNRANKKWIDLGDAKTGIVQYRFPTGSRSRLLFVRIKESSKGARFTYYGCALAATIKDPG